MNNEYLGTTIQFMHTNLAFVLFSCEATYNGDDNEKAKRVKLNEKKTNEPEQQQNEKHGKPSGWRRRKRKKAAEYNKRETEKKPRVYACLLLCVHMRSILV